MISLISMFSNPRLLLLHHFQEALVASVLADRVPILVQCAPPTSFMVRKDEAIIAGEVLGICLVISISS